jgi:hypothetical protein
MRVKVTLTQFSQCVIKYAGLASHSILGIVFGHREEGLIVECVIDAVHEIRAVGLLWCEPRDFYRVGGNFVYGDISRL